jgi:acetyltransferase
LLKNKGAKTAPTYAPVIRALNYKDSSVEIKEINSISSVSGQLNSLLIDCVESGASVGFLTPIDQGGSIL